LNEITSIQQLRYYLGLGHGQNILGGIVVIFGGNYSPQKVMLYPFPPVLRPQTPPSYMSQNKTAQSDVTAETALKSALKKRSEFQNKATLLLTTMATQATDLRGFDR
jgi:hypothetical protein